MELFPRHAQGGVLCIGDMWVSAWHMSATTAKQSQTRTENRISDILPYFFFLSPCHSNEYRARMNWGVAGITGRADVSQ